jgi:outer membrane protein OmpA-like peptidoglycan-associated protein
MRIWISALVAASLSAGCTSRGDSESPVDVAATVPATSSATSAEPVPSSAVAPECREGPGRRVRQLPDLVVPAVNIPPVLDAAGQVVAVGTSIPGLLVDAGCVIRYAAPGGCLGAVRITAAQIPASTIPASTIPADTTPGGTPVPGVEFPAVEAPAVGRPAAYSPRVCQVKRDGELLTVSRAGIVREGFSRAGVARPGGSRPERCDDEGCLAAVEVPTIRLEPVQLGDVDVAPGRLESRKFQGRDDVEVVTGEGRVSYVTPGAVLFATESATIMPAAGAALQAILDRIERSHPGSPLLVEGHTDDRGSAAYGLDLSRRRAASVADWLVDHGVERARITTRGLGERNPAVPNTSEANRAQNRRVVITVIEP